jgi:hypothetical protein
LLTITPRILNRSHTFIFNFALINLVGFSG